MFHIYLFSSGDHQCKEEDCDEDVKHELTLSCDADHECTKEGCTVNNWVGDVVVSKTRCCCNTDR